MGYQDGPQIQNWWVSKISVPYFTITTHYYIIILVLKLLAVWNIYLLNAGTENDCEDMLFCPHDDDLALKLTSIVVIILLLLFTIMLLKSAISEQNPKFLLPWLVFQGLSLILVVIALPYISIQLYEHKQILLLFIFSNVFVVGMYSISFFT